VQKVALQENFSSKNFLAGKINLMKFEEDILTKLLDQDDTPEVETPEGESQEETTPEEIPEGETEETEDEGEEW